jgi:hypothetical protein
MAESTCNLSRPPVMISATGKMPSIGNSTAAVVPTSQPPAPGPSPAPDQKKSGGKGAGAGEAPTLTGTLAKTLKASALAKGLPLTVKVKKAGQVTATGKVGGAVVAKGATKAKRAGTVTLRLTATKAWSKRLAQLVGKTLKLSVKGPGGTLTLIRKLG